MMKNSTKIKIIAFVQKVLKYQPRFNPPQKRVQTMTASVTFTVPFNTGYGTIKGIAAAEIASNMLFVDAIHIETELKPSTEAPTPDVVYVYAKIDFVKIK